MNNNKAAKTILFTLFILFAILAIYLTVRPIQEPTGKYENIVECPICPGFKIVAVTKSNYAYTYGSAALALSTLAGLGYLSRRKLH